MSTLAIILLVVYVVGVLVAGYFGGQYAWENGRSGYGGKPKHDHEYAWLCAFGYGVFWPILLAGFALVVVIMGLCWPFTTDRAKRVAGRMWGK
jgi:ABC-type Fe3+ transport system permease subunit